jgi:transposase
MILASSSGTPVPAIARLVAADEDTVRDVIHAFNERGLAALDPHWAGGAPRRISDDDVAFIVTTATTRPKKLGLPFTHFSVRKLAAYLQGRYGRDDPKQVPARQVRIHRERLRQILACHDITFQRTRTWKESTDPGLRDQTGPHRGSHHPVPRTVFRVRPVRAAVDPPLSRHLLGRP